MSTNIEISRQNKKIIFSVLTKKRCVKNRSPEQLHAILDFHSFSINAKKICMQLYCSIVSAPLRGITFLNNEKQRNGTCYSRVSVPLWGITFLNQIPCDTKMTHHVSIPLQGITFLNRTGARQRTGVRQVSVPLRGITFLNPVPGTLVIKWVSGT